jgi:hypothetical protein
MASRKFTTPIQIGDTASGVNGVNAAATAQQLADYNNPVSMSFVRIPVAGQAVVSYKLPTNAILLDYWLDVTTVWTSGAVNLGTTSNGTELGTHATLTAAGRLAPTLTAARIIAGKADSLGAGQVTVYASPSSTVGAGVGEVVLMIGYSNHKAND